MEQRKTNALGIVFFVGMFIWGAVLFYHYIGALDWWLDFRSATTRFLGTTAIVALTLFLARLVIYFVPIFLLFAGRSLLDVVSIFVFGCCSTYRSYSLVCDYRRDGMAAAFRRFI